MMTSGELSRFERSLRGTRVLTVYLNLQEREGAAGEAGRRRELDEQVAVVQEGLRGSPHAELAAFHQCIARLERALDAAFTDPVTRGWAGFIPVEGEPWFEALPVQMPTLVAWQAGPRIAPYVRALKQHVPALVAILGENEPTTFRYAHGTLERVAAPPMPPAPDAVDALVARVATLAGPDAWIFVGGRHAAATQAIKALPDAMQRRAHWMRDIDAAATEAQVREAAERVATAASRERDLELVLDVFDRVAIGGLGVAGPVATRAALVEGVVETLFFTARFVRENAPLAEELVRLALDHASGLEYVSAAAAERLDEGEGVGALLRAVPARAGARSRAFQPG